MKYLLILFLSLSSIQIYSQSSEQGLVKHVVLFRYNDKVEQNGLIKAEIRKRFLELKKISTKNGRPYIVSINAGYFHGHEGAENGLTDGYILTFKSLEDRDFYVGCDSEYKCSEGGYKSANLPYDKAHDKFKAFVGPLLFDGDGNGPVGDGVIVFDFVSN